MFSNRNQNLWLKCIKYFIFIYLLNYMTGKMSNEREWLSEHFQCLVHSPNAEQPGLSQEPKHSIQISHEIDKNPSTWATLLLEGAGSWTSNRGGTWSQALGTGQGWTKQHLSTLPHKAHPPQPSLTQPSQQLPASSFKKPQPFSGLLCALKLLSTLPPYPKHLFLWYVHWTLKLKTMKFWLIK